MDEPCIYEICVEGQLSKNWSEWFDGLAIYNEPGNKTMLRGSFIDQAALFGTLTKIRSLNLILISVIRMPAL
jgi:hypothetical protein